jgi:hypothetical protein
MKKIKKVLILVIVCTALTCSVWAIFSQSNISTVTEVIPPGEYTPPENPEKLPPLESDEEAIAITDEFLKNQLGLEFFNSHLKIKGVDRILEGSYWWEVEYEYTYGEYAVDFLISIYAGPILKDESRIYADSSIITLEPQKILISEEQAKIIAQEHGLEPPYKDLDLYCVIEFKRICWRVVKKDVKCGELKGFLIDAESGEIIHSWVRTQ